MAMPDDLVSFLKPGRPAAFSFALGDVQCWVISDGRLPGGPPRELFPDLTDEQVAAAFVDPEGTISKVELPENLLVADIGQTRVLFEAGAGTLPELAGKLFGSTPGQALANLRIAGLDPASIDIVALTHADPDHAWGLLDDDGQSAFPNAEVALTRDEFEYWMSQPNDSSADISIAAVGARRSLTAYEDRLRLLDPGQDLMAGVAMIPTPGHNPGHCAFRIDTSSGSLITWGDLSHHVVQFRWPKLGAGFDYDRADAIRSRQTLFAEVARHSWVVHGYHLPYPGIGTLEADGTGAYSWRPIAAKTG